MCGGSSRDSPPNLSMSAARSWPEGGLRHIERHDDSAVRIGVDDVLDDGISRLRLVAEARRHVSQNISHIIPRSSGPRSCRTRGRRRSDGCGSRARARWPACRARASRRQHPAELARRLVVLVRAPAAHCANWSELPGGDERRQRPRCAGAPRCRSQRARNPRPRGVDQGAAEHGQRCRDPHVRTDLVQERQPHEGAGSQRKRQRARAARRGAPGAA